MPRPLKVCEQEQETLKNFMLYGIICDNAKSSRDFIRLLGLTYPQLHMWNYQIYMMKFKLSYKEPYACEEDISKFNQWYNDMEANGAWIGSNTTIKAISQRETQLKDTPPPFKSMEYVINAARENPSIKTFGDYQRWENSEEN
jgi:hypothetical protein